MENFVSLKLQMIKIPWKENITFFNFLSEKKFWKGGKIVVARWSLVLFWREIYLLQTKESFGAKPWYPMSWRNLCFIALQSRLPSCRATRMAISLMICKIIFITECQLYSTVMAQGKKAICESFLHVSSQQSTISKCNNPWQDKRAQFWGWTANAHTDRPTCGLRSLK